MSPITQAGAVGAASVFGAAVKSDSRWDARDNVPTALRAYETRFHNSGDCLIRRLLRRCTLEAARADRPRHFVVAV